MTDAEAKLTTRIMIMPISQLKACAIEAGGMATDEATMVLDFCLARLAGRMTDAEFIAFCEALPEAEFHANN